MLIKKLIEEAKECKVNLTAEELTDVYDVLGALVLEAGFTMSDISAIHTEKTEKLGDFTGGHFIKTLIVPNDSEWAHYYGADPHRFPEIIEGL